MVGTRQIIVGFAVIALFTFAFISFAVNFQTEWGANQSILDDSRISSMYSGVNSSIAYSDSISRQYSDTLYNETDPAQKGTATSILFGGIVAIANAFTGTATRVFSAIFAPLLSALGLPQEAAVIVGTVFSVIFLIVTILLAWKLLRQGA